MSSDLFYQLKNDLQKCCYFSLQLDESTDVIDTSQLEIFVKMIFSDFTVKEDLIKIIPLKNHTTGEDIYSEVKKLIVSENIPIQNLVGITTDGAPGFIGVDMGFIAICRKDEMFPCFLSYHCIIHQQ